MALCYSRNEKYTGLVCIDLSLFAVTSRVVNAVNDDEVLIDIYTVIKKRFHIRLLQQNAIHGCYHDGALLIIIIYRPRENILVPCSFFAQTDAASCWKWCLGKHSDCELCSATIDTHEAVIKPVVMMVEMFSLDCQLILNNWHSLYSTCVVDWNQDWIFNKDNSFSD